MQLQKSGKQFVCSHPGCNKEYSTKFALKRHAVTHSGKKQFPCRFCNKKFSLEQYQKEHEYIHTNETPYVCGIDGCTEAFRQRAKLCLHRMGHKNYKKKSYRVFSRKSTKTENRVVKNKKSLQTIEWQPTYQDSFPNQFNELQNQEMMNSMMLGYDYSGLLATLSSKYCMCELFEGYYDYQSTYPGLVDLTCMLDKESNMQKVKNNLSTLQIPKASYATNSEEQQSPSTFEASPSLRDKPEGSFTQYYKQPLAQAQVACNTFIGY